MISPNLWFGGATGVGMPVFHWETAGYAGAGHRVDLLLYDPSREDEGVYEGVRVHRFRVPGPKWGGPAGRRLDGVRFLEYLAPASLRAGWGALYTWKCLRRASPLTRRRGYDVVYAHTQWSVPAGWRLSRRLGAPLVVRYYGAEDLGVHALEGCLALKYYDRIPAFRLPSARIVMTDDGSWDPAIGRAFGVPDGRVLCLRNGVDHGIGDIEVDRAAWRRRWGFPAGSPVLLCLSRLAPEKRVWVSLRAVARLPGVCMVVAGEGGERAALEAEARRLGVARQVCFTGPLDRSEVARALMASDVLVSAYRTANFSNHLWEAMVAALPAVLADQGQGARYVEDGLTGVLVRDEGDEGDLPARFVAALRPLLEDPVRRAAMGRRARSWARRELPSWERRIAMGAAVLREAVVHARGERA